MTMRFVESGASPRVYLVTAESSENQPATGWFSFLLAPGTSGPAWGVLQPADTLGMAGFYVTCPRAPANLTAFVEAATSALDAFIRKRGVANRSASWFVWFSDPDATGEAMGLQVLSVSRTADHFLTDTVSPNVTVRDVVLQISAGAGVTYDAGAGAFAIFAGAGLSLTVGGQGHTVGTVDQSLLVPVSGPQRGCVGGSVSVTRWQQFDIISPSVSYYVPDAAGRTLRQRRFPLFDGSAIGDGVSLDLLLDPATPESPDRTSLAFGQAVPLASDLRTPLGQVVTLTPEAHVTRIAFANLPQRLADGVAQTGGLTPVPEGPFEVGLAGGQGSPQGGAGGATASAALLPGLAGTEYLEVPVPGTTLTFAGGRPALVPFPLDQPAAAGGGALLTTGGGGATTAWAQLSGAGGLDYHAQPQAAPLYAAPASAPGGSDVAVLEPQPTVLWTGTATPLVPLTPYAGADAASADGAVLLEQRAVALTRQRAFAGATRAARSGAPRRSRAGLAAARVWSADHRGFRVGLQDGRAAAVTLASTPAGPGGPLVDLTLEIAQAVVAEALAGEQVFLVATTTVDRSGAGLFTFDGALYLAGWEATAGLASTWDEHAEVGTSTPMMIVKLGSKPVADLAQSLDEWTDAEVFLPRPEATQAALARFIAEAQQATADASLYADFLQVVTDPSWTGVLFLNAHLGQAPPVIRGVLSGVPTEDVRWHHAGVSLSQVQPDSDLSLSGSATFGLVDYTAAGTPSLSGSDYTFWTRWLQALFVNSSLASFDCRVALDLQRFFGVPLASPDATGGTGAGGTAPVIEISGVYQERTSGGGGDDATGVYSFITTEPHTFAFDYSAATSLVTAEILKSLTLTKVQLAPAGQTDEEITSDFLFWGTLEFGRIVGGPSGAGLDVFNYDALPFGSIALSMSSPVAGGPPDRWALGTAQATFDLHTATVRPGGLVGCLPLDLRSLRYDGGSAFGLADLGYRPLGLPPGNPDQVGAVEAALLYTVDLGRPGTLGGAETIVASVLCGWTPDGGVLLGISIPGLGSDGSLAFDGVVKLLLGSFRLNTVTPPSGSGTGGQAPLVTLEFASCTYELLGVQFPQAPLSLTLVVADPGATGTVLWYASWPPPGPPGAMPQGHARAVRVGGLARDLVRRNPKG